MKERILVFPQLKHYPIHCEACGRFTRGSTSVESSGGSHQVCNVQCGINLIVKRQGGLKLK